MSSEDTEYMCFDAALFSDGRDNGNADSLRHPHIWNRYNDPSTNNP